MKELKQQYADQATDKFADIVDEISTDSKDSLKNIDDFQVSPEMLDSLLNYARIYFDEKANAVIHELTDSLAD